MEIALRSAGNNGAADFERVFTSMVESSVLNTVLVAAKSLLCLLALMGSLSHETNTLGTEAEVMTGLPVVVMGKNKAEPENKDAGDSEDDDGDEEEDAEDDQDDDGDSDDDGNDDEGDGNDDDPEANGEEGSDDDDDDDDEVDDEDDDDDDGEEDDDEEEEEDEEIPQPASKKRK